MSEYFFLEHSWTIFILQGQMDKFNHENQISAKECVHALILKKIWNNFSFPDYKIKIFHSTEVINEDTVGIPLFPAYFSLFSLKQTAVKMISFPEVYLYATTITDLDRK